MYLDWLRYLSWFMYSNEALTINQWQGIRFNTTECSANKSIPLITCTGEDVIKQFEFKPVSLTHLAVLNCLFLKPFLLGII